MKKYGPQTDTSAISPSVTGILGGSQLQLIDYTTTDNIQSDVDSSFNNNNNDSSPEIYDEFLQNPLEHSRLLEPNNN